MLIFSLYETQSFFNVDILAHDVFQLHFLPFSIILISSKVDYLYEARWFASIHSINMQSNPSFLIFHPSCFQFSFFQLGQFEGEFDTLPYVMLATAEGLFFLLEKYHPL